MVLYIGIYTEKMRKAHPYMLCGRKTRVSSILQIFSTILLYIPLTGSVYNLPMECNENVLPQRYALSLFLRSFLAFTIYTYTVRVCNGKQRGNIIYNDEYTFFFSSVIYARAWAEFLMKTSEICRCCNYFFSRLYTLYHIRRVVQQWV